jgi:hypothetical protein
MFKRLAIFSLIAMLLLPAGYLFSQWVWNQFHHRYESPDTGFYYGAVRVYFHSTTEPFFALSFRGETDVRWYWSQPINFSYSTLDVEWTEDGADQSATVNLPGFTYQSGSESGAFTHDVLAKWLRGSGDELAKAWQQEEVFRYFEAASRGELPPPRHHPHHQESPIRVSVQHFLLGFGVGSTAYFWLGVWLLMVGSIGRKILAGGRGRAPSKQA